MKMKILGVGYELAIQIRKTRNSKLLFDLFEIRTKDRRFIETYEKCGPRSIFSDFCKNLHGSDFAFELISVATRIVLNQNEIEKLAVALCLLEELTFYTHTTEIPSDLKAEWDNISHKVYETGKEKCILLWKEICRWYRVKTEHP